MLNETWEERERIGPRCRGLVWNCLDLKSRAKENCVRCVTTTASQFSRSDARARAPTSCSDDAATDSRSTSLFPGATQSCFNAAVRPLCGANDFTTIDRTWQVVAGEASTSGIDPFLPVVTVGYRETKMVVVEVQ